MSQDNDIEQSMTANDVTGVLADQSEVLLDTAGGERLHETHDEQWRERESRNALKHVAGLGEMQDVTEVEYRKVRLERVVLVGVWSSRETTQGAAEESLRELAALAETAGAVVCDGLLQHRVKPDAYIVSAFSGEGVEALREKVESMLPTPNVHVEALLPYAAGSLMSRVREYGRVVNVEYRDDGMMLEAEVDDQLAAQIVEQAID